MATHAALHISTPDLGRVVSELSAYLERQHGSTPSIRPSETLGPIYDDLFICSETEPPTMFSVASEQAGWLTAHYNSFHPLHELAQSLSQTAGALLVACIAQSVSSGYRVAVYRYGIHQRTLCFADGEWIEQEGEPLPFERQPLGTDISGDPSSPFYVFDRDDAIDYCRHMGLQLWDDAYRPTTWTWITVP
jgi:hypothetical protein